MLRLKLGGLSFNLLYDMIDHLLVRQFVALLARKIDHTVAGPAAGKNLDKILKFVIRQVVQQSPQSASPPVIAGKIRIQVKCKKRPNGTE